MAVSMSKRVNDKMEMNGDCQPPTRKKPRIVNDAATACEDETEEVDSKTNSDLKSLCKLSAIQSYSKLCRLEKLISSLLISMNAALENNEPYFPKKISKKWCSKLEEQIVTLSGTQTCNILSTLVFHLEANCVKPLEVDPLDVNSIRMLPILTQLLHSHLRTVRIAEHTVPVTVVSRFNTLFDKLKVLLGRLGAALLHKEHDDTLMASFLSSSLAWGDLQLLLMYYRPPNVLPKLTHADTSATNLSTLHPYLSDDQWSLVAQRITNFGGDRCLTVMDLLVTQKVRAMVLLDKDTCREAISSAVNHLIAKPANSWQQLLDIADAGLISRMCSKQALKLADEVVKNVALGGEVTPVSIDHLNENRPFVAYLLVSTLTSIQKCFNKSQKKPKLINNVFNWLTPDYVRCLDVPQIDKPSTEILIVVSDIINEFLGTKNERAKPTSYPSIDSHELLCYLAFLHSLPLQYLHPGLQTYVLCCIIAITLTIGSPAKVSDLEENSVREKLQKYLLFGMLEGPKVPNLMLHLNAGPLVWWLVQQNLALESLQHQRMLEVLFRMSIQEENDAVTSLLSIVPPLCADQPDDVLNGTQHVESAAVLLKTLAMSRPSRKLLSKENQSVCTKAQRSLYRHLAALVMAEQVGEECHLLILKAFYEVMQKDLKKKEPKILIHKPHLATCFKMAVDCLRGGITDSACLDFLVLLLTHRKILDDALPSDHIIQVWQVYASVVQLGGPIGHYQIIFKAATDVEFHQIAKKMFETVTNVTSMDPTDSIELDKCLALWAAMLSLESDKRKSRWLIKLLNILLVAMQFGRIIDPKPVLKLSLAFIRRKERTNPETFSFCLEAASICPSADLSTVALALQLLNAMLGCCSEMVFDQVPAFLQRFTALVGHIGRLSAQDALAENDSRKLGETAQEVERLALTMSTSDKHFRRITPYIIADILRLFEVVTLPPVVKLHLTNSVHSFLRIADSHAIGFLNHVLSPASQQIFQIVYSNYMKYYQFKGRA